MTSPGGALRLAEAGASVGVGVRAWLGDRVSVGPGVVIGDGATVVADDVQLGAGAVIGDGCDVRASSIRVGAGSELGQRVQVLAAELFAVGPGSRLEADIAIACRSFTAGDLFYLGHHSSVGYGGTTAGTARVTIGDRVAIGPHSILNANRGITLEDQVGSGCNLTVWTHGFHFGHRLLDGYEAVFADVHVARNVWLGYHVTLLPGVHVGANTILAAGAVVARDLPADVLAGGVPATVKRALTARPLQGRAADDRIAAVLGEWAEELTWKGVDVTGSGPGGMVIASSHRVSLVRAGAPAPPPDAHRPVLLTADAREDLRSGAGLLFELRSGQLWGGLDDIGHDLRDFLRRHAMPCGSTEPFRSLPVQAFHRLQHPEGTGA